MLGERREKRKSIEKERKDKIQAKKQLARDFRKSRPKKALSAYMFFVNEERPKIINELKHTYPGGKVPVAKIGSLAGERWRAFPQQDKEKYLALAKLDKERSAKERGAWLQIVQAKKKPVKGYALFVRKHSPQYKAMSFKERGQKLAQEWRSLSKSQKQSFSEPQPSL